MSGAAPRGWAGLPVGEMRRWYLAGESNASIGRRLGIHQSKVRRVLLADGVAMRSRRDQVALKDRRARIRVPSCEELTVGYVEERLTMAELAERHELTEARVLLLLRRCGIERRPGGIRPERAEDERKRRRPPQLIDRIITLYQSGLSTHKTAAQLGVDRHVVTDVLRRAGIALRGPRKLPPESEWVHRYVDGGETAAEIAATYGATPTAVLGALERAGIERRPAVVRTRSLRDDDVIRCYVDDQMSLQSTARQLGVSTARVRAVVERHGVLRAPGGFVVFDPARLDQMRFERLYTAGATTAELAARFGITRHHVLVARRAYGLPPRLPVTHNPLTTSDRQLAALIAGGHSDTDIANEYGVSTWAVTRRRRASGLWRAPPNQLRPPISRAGLVRHLAAGKTRADIATMHRVGLDTVTRWCASYGIEVGRPRPTAGTHVDLDPTVLRHLYVDEQWTTTQIAGHLGVDTALITFALHTHRIPVRRPGNRTQGSVVILDALYADPDVVDTLKRHQLPLRRRGGPLAKRFPDPAPLDLAHELYRRVGLSTNHIALLTGHSATNVLDALRHHGTPTRPGSRSPWYQRTITGTHPGRT